MFGIVLKFTLTSLIGRSSLLEFLFGLVSVDVVIDVGITIDINVHVTTAPVAIAPRITPSRAHRDARAKPHHRRSYVAGWIIRIWRVSRVWPSAVHDCGVVRWHINDLRIGSLDLDDLLFDNDCLFFSRV
jgi:hypothetical protein